jgi:hypothetical protein
MSEPDAYLVERRIDGEWRSVGATTDEVAAGYDARGERGLGNPARVVPLYRRPASCTWTEDFDGYWDTGCLEVFGFDVNGPVENHYRYCPGCGRPLEAVPYAEDGDDAEDADPRAAARTVRREGGAT